MGFFQRSYLYRPPAGKVYCMCHSGDLQQTRSVDQMLVQCWANVVDGGPTLGQLIVFVCWDS